jgi:peptidoglycan/xylan/chitin deacetylase (PgdA/CDA1 family)
MTGAVLLLIDPRDRAALDVEGLALDGFGPVITRIVDYDRLESEAESIVAEARAQGVALTLYSRNDQVFGRRQIGPLIRRLRTGYSSFSGIDTAAAHAQARRALEDLRSLPRGTRLELPPPAVPAQAAAPISTPAGTFSLIFDTEQMGGVRFGLPRILALLDRYQVPATFFVTGLIHQVYPDLLAALAARGHEIGIHGPNHEWLADLPPDEQARRLRDHLAAFRACYPVVGANFIFRMDAGTLRALAGEGIRYCVAFAQHHYRPFAYRRLSTRPLPVHTGNGALWLIPVPVETYSRPWFGARLLIDSALRRSALDGAPHVCILMHPFRDGSLRHVPQLEAMLRYLTGTHRLMPVTLREQVSAPPPARPDALVLAAIARIDASYPESERAGVWTRSELYFERLAVLHRALGGLGHCPALAVDGAAGDAVRRVAVFPEGPSGAMPVAFDPLAAVDAKGSAWETLLAILEQAAPGQTLAFGPPPGSLNQRAGVLRPRCAQDVIGLVPELVIRLACRMRPGRLVF